MRLISPVLLIALLCSTLAAVAGELPSQPRDMVPPLRPNPPLVSGGTRPVDLVVVLDTSGSMEDLIDSARGRIWDIVNELARMKPTPQLRVGLVTFGSPEVATEEDGFVVVQTDLTADLDAAYAKLMALSTAGGDEYVGWALQRAVRALDWSPDPYGLRLIFLAGNESADQAVERVDFRAVAEEARDADIIINALFAGNRDQGVVEKWDEVARHGAGNFSAIDPVTGTVQIPTPHDQALLELNARLNETYLPFGENGVAGLQNQLAQDNNASRLGVQSCSSRIVAKGTALYDNAHWDLVDAALQPEFQWSALRDEDLPESMRSMTGGERRAHVAQLRSQREKIQASIEALAQKREEFIQEWRREQLDATGLDDAMRDALVAQAKAKGFSLDGC